MYFRIVVDRLHIMKHRGKIEIVDLFSRANRPAKRSNEHHVEAGLRIKGCPAKIRAPSLTLSQNSKWSGASTMMVEPCSNQPSSSPLCTLASQGNTVGPLVSALSNRSRKCSPRLATNI